MEKNYRLHISGKNIEKALADVAMGVDVFQEYRAMCPEFDQYVNVVDACCDRFTYEYSIGKKGAEEKAAKEIHNFYSTLNFFFLTIKAANQDALPIIQRKDCFVQDLDFRRAPFYQLRDMFEYIDDDSTVFFFQLWKKVKKSGFKGQVYLVQIMKTVMMVMARPYVFDLHE